MLDKLVESRDAKSEKKLLRSFFVGIGSITTGLFTAGLIFSIFSTNLAMSGEGLEMSRLIAPAAIPDPAPEPDTPEPENKNKTVSKMVEKTTRVVNMMRVDESPTKPPKTISTSKNKYKARPKSGVVNIGPVDNDATPNARVDASSQNSTGSGLNVSNGPKDIEVKNPKPKKKEKKSSAPPPKLKKKKPPIKSGGVLNGKAKYLAMPVRTGAIKATGAKGAIRVNVLIDEKGRVISASASKGNPLLRNSAIAAARKTTFTPTFLSGVPVKVRGIIIYNFK